MTGGLLQLSGIVIDLVHCVDHLPVAGEEVETPDVLITAGGGFNAMIAARNFGVAVSYAGTIGTGLFASMARTMLDKAGIPGIITRQPPQDQGTCIVVVDRSGERSFISYHGAERQLEVGDYAAVIPRNDDWLLLTGYALFKAESARVLSPWLDQLKSGPMFLFDPGPTVADIPQDRLRSAMMRADWVSANCMEARILTGEIDPVIAARKLCKGRAGAIVRSGAEGCWIATSQNDVEFIPAFAVETVDTNGAGDCHDGAFIAASILGHPPMQAALLANASAALSTTRQGPATAPNLTEALSLIESRGLSLAGEPVKPKTINRRN
jgi:sugar/nucleoside kinase (ribokinase family)